MIIICPSCEKKFELEENLIPNEGRLLQCGSCNNEWFFTKPQKKPIKLKEKEANNDKKLGVVYEKTENIEKPLDKTVKKKKIVNKKVSFSFNKFLSYILVTIITFVALIIVIDTFKSPLYKIFPNLELILFNLFETLKDIELFIKDLL